MSQHSFNIADEGGAAFLSDVNSALQALASVSRGTAAPGTTYAGQLWDDTTNNVGKKRNAANSGWIVRTSLDETYLISRSSNTILGLSDFGKTFSCTSTFTQTFTAVATLGDGWWVEYRNDGTGIITLDPNASEQIDNATTLNLYPGESCVINGNGSAFKTVGRGTGPVLIQRQIASASTTLDFTIGIGADFDEYFVEIADMLPATDNTDLWLRVTEDGGSTWKSGGTDYAYTRFANADGGAVSASGSTGDTKIRLELALSNSKAFRGTVKFSAPSATARHKAFRCDSAFEPSGLTIGGGVNAGLFKLDANAINGVRFLMSSGNITAGTFTLYGIRKS